MTISGINGDLYYADNPIFVTLSGLTANTKYVEYSLLTFTGGTGLAPVRYYTHGQTSLIIDISASIKASFPTVANNTNYTSLTPFQVTNNWLNLSIVFKESNLLTGDVFYPAINKTFIKGGKRTYQSNQTTQIGTPLIPSEKIPVWGGLPVDYSYINSEKKMFKSNLIPVALRDIRKIKGCDPAYFKFKNSQGGYSYWLFENWTDETRNKNLGVVEGRTNLLDLGNEEDPRITVSSKVPKIYVDLIKDLIISQEIYLYTDPPSSGVAKQGKIWERVTSSNNTARENPFVQNEKVKLTFDRHHRFAPNVLW